MLIDTHCHLDFSQFAPDRGQVIQRAKEQGIDYLINIGSSLEGSQKSLELAQQYDFIYATVGIHPHEADGADKNSIEALSALAKKDKVVAIGEIGLDYFKNFSRKENQKPLFLSLLKVAKELNLPIVIHSREAEADILEALKPILPHKIIVHCFSGDENFLRECLANGFFISFTCNITYRKADNLRNIVRLAPIEKIMLETDAPYLAPEGLRGQRNDPANVRILAEEISRIKGIKIQEVASITTENAKKFFNLK
jgi:TatD DNase family protein